MINGKPAENYYLKLFDLHGKLIQEVSFTYKVTLQTSDLTTGFYVANITSGNRTAQIKLLKID
ncbi:MAG: T9SS type A sorting domain-containing protein [Saprospiraceae bacterium]|nr:T9SS type A sorting domain-containing protein [Saprospiraceae bacterium]